MIGENIKLLYLFAAMLEEFSQNKCSFGKGCWKLEYSMSICGICDAKTASFRCSYRFHITSVEPE